MRSSTTSLASSSPALDCRAGNMRPTRLLEARDMRPSSFELDDVVCRALLSPSSAFGASWLAGG